MLEGALILWLPPSLKLVKYRHPWQRMYNNKKLALWETDTGYCEKVNINFLKTLMQLSIKIKFNIFIVFLGEEVQDLFTQNVKQTFRLNRCSYF